MPKLYELVESYRSLEALEASDDLPAEAIVDTLESLQGDLTVKATNVAKYIRNVEYTAEAVEEASKAMKRRAERMQKHADSLKRYLMVNMQAAGITKIEATEFVLTVKKNPPSVIIDDAAKIPAKFMVTPPPAPPPVAAPSKALIAAAFKAGETVEGARSEQGSRLEIKA